MAITFNAVDASEHELGVYLGSLNNSSNDDGTFELYFGDQEEYLTLVGDDLYLNSNWQYDFETERVFLLDEAGIISFYDFSDRQVPIKFVDSFGKFDWMYADLKFTNVEEGALTFRGWQSPWAPLQVIEKTTINYIDALLPDAPSKWNSDTFYDLEFSKNESTVITFSFPGVSGSQMEFVSGYDSWKTSNISVFPFTDMHMEAVRLALTEWSKVANITFV